MPNSFFSIDLGKLKASVASVEGRLDEAEGQWIAAVRYAMGGWMNDVIAEAQQKASVRSGDLRGSATVTDPTFDGTWISLSGGFNIGYSRQRDQGGEIVAKNGTMLSIPLDPIMTGRGVARYSSPREEDGLFVLKLWGRVFLAKRRGKTDRTIELHWVLKNRVTQRGDGFFSSVIETRRSTAAEQIGTVAAANLGRVA